MKTKLLLNGKNKIRVMLLFLFVNLVFVEIAAQKDDKCYVRCFKHTSVIDTVKFNSLEGYSQRIDYHTKWKEKCKGFTMGYKADVVNPSLISHIFAGYRSHRMRYEFEYQFGTRDVNSYESDVTQYLAGIYLDLNKHSTSSIKPYFGINVGMVDYTLTEESNYSTNSTEDKMGFSAAATAGVSLRIFPGFYALGEYRMHIMPNIFDNNNGLNVGVRLNL